MPGVRRSAIRKAKRSVLVADYLADRVISLGGVSVLLAVLGILVFLVWEVIPLFQPARIVESHTVTLEDHIDAPVLLGMDEEGAIAFGVSSQGQVFAFHPASGAMLSPPVWELGHQKPTAWAFSPGKENLAIGFQDGSVRIGSLKVVSQLKRTAEVPANLRVLSQADRTDGTAIYRFTPAGEVKVLSLEASLGEPRKISESGRAILKLEYRLGGTDERPTRFLAALDDEMEIWLERVELKRNLLTGQLRESIQSRHMKVPTSKAQDPFLLLGGHGNMLFLVTRDGELLRLDASRPSGQELVERARLRPPGVKITAAAFLSGESSLVLGGSDGSVGTWFLVEKSDAATADGRAVVLARELSRQPGAILGIEPGMRGKTFLTWDALGELRVRHATSEKDLAQVTWKNENGLAAALAPRLDALLALGPGGEAGFWRFLEMHPETSFRTLFGKVWYEGRPGPEFVWQSSGATEDFEPKLSVVPLIFGTLKGTFYAMLFAVPLAILGAIYTSEFLSSQLRARVKPVMELMASLPSVILGFVAALVLAPLVESWISSILIAFVVIPFALLMGGYVFQMLPEQVSKGIVGSAKLLLLVFVIVSSVVVCFKIGPVVEALFFGGDLKEWLSGGAGGIFSPFSLFFLPMAVAICALFLGRRILPGNRGPWGEFGRAATIFVFGCLSSLLAGWVLERWGLDLRDGFVGTYVQRNTLVVALTMGFAVIPLVYTLAEEALSGVPDHLRSASLSCGATPWQTALWIVLPTAASGVFSAVMIGMGRAVGETMIVVMATGNTPIIDINLFNGFRALSANIAVELPEAVKGGTLYRVLFLTALILFSMTFVINTVAELVRQRFRKRAQQL
ncbi:MAG: ABC transporter permease subunit [Thermodesulfobacteriota bacterium]